MNGQSNAFRRVLIAAVPLVLLAGCATPQDVASQSDLDALRADVEQLRSEVRASTARSDEAARAAQAAADEARAASERADRIYQQSLRK